MEFQTALPEQKQKTKDLAALFFMGISLFFLILTLPKTYTSIISPLSSDFFGSMQIAKNNHEIFSFVPGQAQNKFDNIELKGLDTLAFFDVPLTVEAGMNTESYGYASFRSEAAQELFHRAHLVGSKVVVALTMSSNREIKSLLSSTASQDELIEQAILEVQDAGIDGVSIDFENINNWNSFYKEQYTKFISNFVSRMHGAIPSSLVTVAIPSSNLKKEDGIDVSAVSRVADKVFVIASDTIVSEDKNLMPVAPVFGYKDNQYWDDAGKKIIQALQSVPENKLVLERAWYGNGDNYPLYRPSATPDTSVTVENNSEIDPAVVKRLIAGVPAGARDSARKNLPYIIDALKDEGILNPSVLSYAMATIEHETAGSFEPIDEIQGRFSARRLGYEGGANYFGRGFIQLTHLRNYRIIGERIGLDDKLARNPELASEPKIAAKILAAYFKDNNVATLASNGDFIDARTPINPDRNGYHVALLAFKYEDSFYQ